MALDDEARVSAPGSMDLRQFLGLLWRRRLLVGAITLIAVVVGLTVVVSQGKKYRAVAQLNLTATNTTAGGQNGLATQQELNLIAANFSKVIEARGFIDDAARGAGISRHDAVVTGDNPLNTSVLQVSVVSSSSTTAETVAAAIVQSVQRVADASAPSGVGTDSAVVIQEPVVSRASANSAFVLFVALVVGLALGATAALLLGD